MTIDINAIPSFGKARRDEAWARVRRNEATLSVSPLRFGLTIGSIAALIVLLGLDALALLINDGEQGLWLLPRSGEAMLAGLHPAVIGGVMLVMMIVLVDFAAGLMSLFGHDEPVAIIDYTGGIVLTRDGQSGFRWEDVERIRRRANARQHPGLFNRRWCSPLPRRVAQCPARYRPRQRAVSPNNSFH
jgi:hypothetical protein